MHTNRHRDTQNIHTHNYATIIHKHTDTALQIFGPELHYGGCNTIRVVIPPPPPPSPVPARMQTNSHTHTHTHADTHTHTHTHTHTNRHKVLWCVAYALSFRKLSAVFGVYMFALLRVCVCVCVCELLCAFRRVLLALCLPVCVADTLHDPGSLGPKPFETRDLFPYMYHVDHGHNCNLTIV